MGDGAPKSAYELAMEKLKRQDEAAGVESVALTPVQIEAIAEARRGYEARVAESHILHRSAVAGAADAHGENLVAGFGNMNQYAGLQDLMIEPFAFVGRDDRRVKFIIFARTDIGDPVLHGFIGIIS